MRFQRHQSALVLAPVVTVALFVGATAYTQHRLFRLDALSSTIVTQAAPSIQYLARSGAHLARLRQMLISTVSSPVLRPESLKDARVELNELEGDTSRVLRLKPLAGEKQPLWDGLRTDVHRAISVADSVLDAAETGDIPAAREALWSKIEAFDRATLFDLTPFRAKPLWRMPDGKVLCIDIPMVMERLGPHVFWSVMSALDTSERRIQFTRTWGNAFEDYCLDRLADVTRRTAAGTLEHHMLEQKRDAVQRSWFVARADLGKQSDCSGLQVGHGVACHAQARFQRRQPHRGHGISFRRRLLIASA